MLLDLLAFFRLALVVEIGEERISQPG